MSAPRHTDTTERGLEQLIRTRSRALAYRNAKRNSDKQNSRIEHDKPPARVMTAVLKEDLSQGADSLRALVRISSARSPKYLTTSRLQLALRRRSERYASRASRRRGSPFRTP